MHRPVKRRHIGGMIEISKLDNFLYLLSEMEGVRALGGIGWNATIAVNVRDRLIAVTSEIAIIAERLEGWPSTKPARGSIWRPEGGRSRNRTSYSGAGVRQIWRHRECVGGSYPREM